MFKFWLMWKALGNIGIENRIDKAFDNAKYLAGAVESRDGFQLLLQVSRITR